MAILDKFKKKTFMMKTALGYVTYYFETLASIVKMTDGRNVEDCIHELNSRLDADQSPAVNPQGRCIGKYKGKALYEVTISGNMSKFTSANSLQDININHGIPNISSIVGVTSSKYGNWDGPYVEAGVIKTCIGQITKTVISFRNMAAWGAGYTWTVTFRYIKS